MHPTAQTSTADVYFYCPSKIYGALYHKVYTSWVNYFWGIIKTLPNPKSASLTFYPKNIANLIPLLSIKIFCGFKSLWSTFLSWQ